MPNVFQLQIQKHCLSAAKVDPGEGAVTECLKEQAAKGNIEDDDCKRVSPRSGDFSPLQDKTWDFTS